MTVTPSAADFARHADGGKPLQCFHVEYFTEGQWVGFDVWATDEIAATKHVTAIRSTARVKPSDNSN